MRLYHPYVCNVHVQFMSVSDPLSLLCVCVHVDPTTQRGKALFVLCEQELLAVDLEAPK